MTDGGGFSIVTGGAGFIGSHLVDRLVREGRRVAVIDNLEGGKLSNLSEARQSGLVDFHQADVAEADQIGPLFEGVETVYHLAGLADIVPSIEDPLRYLRANVDGTATVMEAAHRAGVRRVVYAASSSCYGIPDNFPTNEEAQARPEYPYALTKYLGEQIALHWGRVYGVGVVSLRLFNVYGPRSRTSGAYGAVFGVFLAQRLAGQRLTIVGDGTQTRDFTYVTDVADAFVKAAESDTNLEVLNVGSGGTYSVNLLARLVGGETTNIPKRPGEPGCTYADTRKIRRMLGWEPLVTFEEGVAAVLERIEDWADAPVWTPDTIADATRAWFENLSQPVNGEAPLDARA